MVEKHPQHKSFDTNEVLWQVHLLSGINDVISGEEYPGGVDDADYSGIKVTQRKCVRI